MDNRFFTEPIRNSPYEYPHEYWELDPQGQPTQRLIQARRPAEFITPIPKPRKRKSKGAQSEMVFDEGKGISTEEQQYDPTPIINELRVFIDEWRKLRDPKQWLVTPETARLLDHWRNHAFSTVRPFFCQVEAAETLIWLTEVAPSFGKRGARFLDHLANANNDANPGLTRLALKLATGAGKTTVMAMVIAWQTINSVRRPNSKTFTRGFLVVAPGLTIKDRLRVLQPNDPDSYYESRELVPTDMLPDLKRAKIVITNYHAFKPRDRMEISRGGRQLLQGRTGEEVNTLETEGQMIQRVMPELMGLKNIFVLNDEAHHCYREKPRSTDADGNDANADADLKGEEKQEAEKNREAARLWMSGLEAVGRKLGIARLVDLSATPFFLRGSGYVEGTLFPWTMSDFSLMDAIESGIVKLPRVPVADNIPGGEVPNSATCGKTSGRTCRRRGRVKRANSTRSSSRRCYRQLSRHFTAITKRHSNFGRRQRFRLRPASSSFATTPRRPSSFTTTSPASIVRTTTAPPRWRTEGWNSSATLTSTATPLARPRTLLIDSEQLESGEALDDNFRTMAADEIDRFKREIVARTGDQRAADNLSDAELLREAMNTVGKLGRLGESIRCVVSVSMLTEGWDANTVTHVLGVRAFGTQLLCEQVIGRALRRQSYDLNENDRFGVEYADILGIPFDFTAKPVIAAPQPPRETILVQAISPERDALEVSFPRVSGYRVELPEERLTAAFGPDSILELTPELVGPTSTDNSGIIGESVNLTVEHLADLRPSTVLYHLTQHLIYKRFRDPGEEPKLYLFGQLKRIAKQWLDTSLVCKGGTYPGQLLYQELADRACDRIMAAITQSEVNQHNRPVKAVLDPYNPVGSTRHVRFTTSKTDRWQTSPEDCHINWVILDSDWEAEFCRVAEAHPRVKAYVKNHNLGFEVPYRAGSEARRYRPDFIVCVDDGRGSDDLLHLVVEIKGYRGEDAKDKKATMDAYWVPGVNRDARYGRWAFAEFVDVWEIGPDFEEKVEGYFNTMITASAGEPAGVNP